MWVSTNRLETFSDGIMAIIITIMAFQIPLPTTIDTNGILQLSIGVGIFFVSFIVVGSQWIKHHYLFTLCGDVTNSILWCNLLFLFFLCLVPLLTKWIMVNPTQTVPAMCYDIMFFLLTISYHALYNAILKNSKHALSQTLKQHQNYQRRRMLLLPTILGIPCIILLSYYSPSISLILFVCFPVLTSLFNLNREQQEFTRPSRRELPPRRSSFLPKPQ